ncbi:putative secreted protein (Por secretion system target) [Ulvibacter sp. MAR_2010_11]|uniref:leucine-rich repeat domain-containing protein n=1 Tax=Ulvibacter sp. MAR_2010_11 TaxID=1250229 RepID=UPI000C2BC4FE|nr:T9SS type A sorting domain-containing protein [Ulvibacter sp. MAR_2010_11]PKA82596.1 putative secreted protein (Por secretion system target) [Ulvibacter sp. MAR_2010_11]
MRFVCLFILMFVSAILNAQIVNIPDPVFKNALVNTPCVDTNGDGSGDADADTNDDGEIQVAEAEAVLGLYIPFTNINSLTGLESFINLEVFQCQTTFVTGIDVSTLTNLRVLLISDNNLLNLDITQNPYLERLDCHGNDLNNLIVSQNPLLVYLNCAQNDLSVLDVQNNTVLETLSIGGQSIAAIDLSQNPNLELLNFEDNNFTALDISNNPNLVGLFVAENKLTQLDLSQNPNLEVITCSENQLVELDVSQNTSLEFLWCHENSLTSLNLKNGNNVVLNYMRAENNPNLSCIQVDDVDYANQQTNWLKDGSAVYSEECALGVENMELSSQIFVYPNPVEELLFIESTLSIEIESLKMYNLLGELILSKTKDFTQTDVSALKSGMYFLKVSTEAGSSTKRVIKL